MGRIYISSTFEDLKDHREAVYRVLRRQGHDVVCMEDYVARDERPLDRCLSDVRRCDLYVGLFAFRYGYVPANQPDGAGRSITELEYREAGAATKERLCFLLDKRAPWPLDLVDDDRRAINALRTEIEAEHSRSTFLTTDELGTRVLEAVVDWEKRVGYVPPVGAQSSTLDVAGYSRKIHERYGRVELDALVPPERDEQLRIPLDAIYVEQSVRADRPPVELSKELWEKLQHAGEISPEDLPHGVTAADLEAARSAFRERPTSRVFDALAGSGGTRVVLLGDPGAGKSTLTRYVLLSLLDSGGDPRVRTAYPETLPLMVELRKFAGLRAEGRCETFLDYFALLGRTEGFCLTADALIAHLRSQAPTLVIFDGLDELFDPRLRETVTHQIAGFASDHPHVRLLVTSRIVGYSSKTLADAGFAHFTLQDLGRSEIERFLAAWFVRVLADRPEDANLRRQRILAAVDDSRSIRMIAGNPMLLTIMAIIGKNQELPRERAELYQHAATVLVEHWDVKKHLIEADLDIGFDRQEKLELLRRISWAMQAAPGGLAGNYVQDERLLEVIQAFVEERFGELPARARRIATVMIRQLRERNFILCLYGAGLYGFVHRSFLEYFCASAIQRQFEKTQELSVEQLKRDVYCAHWEDEAWREVLRLVAGLIEPRFAGEVIDHLASAIYTEWPQEFGDRPPRNLALAVECLREVRNLLSLEQVGERLLRRLIALLEHGDKVEDAARNALLLEEVLPAVDAIGERWPGRLAVQDWFWQRGPNLEWHPLSLVWCRMVGALYRSDVRSFPFLLQLSQTGEKRLRRAALATLAACFKDRPETFSAVVDVLRHSEGWSRKDEAATLLGRELHDHPLTFQLLLDSTRSDDDACAVASLIALSQYFSERDQTFDVVVQLLNDHTPLRRSEAIFALSHFADRPETFGLLTQLFETNKAGPTLVSTIEVLGTSFSTQPETFALLIARAESTSDHGVRSMIIDALSRHFADRGSTFDLLVRSLQSDAAPVVRRTAAFNLGSFAKEGVAALLRRAAQSDPDATVRSNAVGSILRVLHLDDRYLNLASRDWDGFRPFFDPWRPLPVAHLKAAPANLGVSETEVKQMLTEMTAALGWDPRVGLRRQSKQRSKRNRHASARSSRGRTSSRSKRSR